MKAHVRSPKSDHPNGRAGDMTKPVVSFTAMEDGTQADYERLRPFEDALCDSLAESVLGWLQAMDIPSGYQVTRLGHSLQTAARAEADGASDEMVACALLHDIGDILSPANHAEASAAVLRPYVSEEAWWIVRHHGLFQGYYYFHFFGRDRDERDHYRDHAHYEATVESVHGGTKRPLTPRTRRPR